MDDLSFWSRDNQTSRVKSVPQVIFLDSESSEGLVIWQHVQYIGPVEERGSVKGLAAALLDDRRRTLAVPSSWPFFLRPASLLLADLSFLQPLKRLMNHNFSVNIETIGMTGKDLGEVTQFVLFLPQYLISCKNKIKQQV